MGAKLAGVLMAAFAGVALPHTSWGEASPQVRVILLNDRVVPVDLAERAQAEVTRLYKLIGVEVVWVAEPPPDAELRTIKVTTWEPREDQFPFALGMTPAQSGTRGTRGYVFWGRVQRHAHKHAAGFDSLLAVAIAHELGHMLLPAGSHAKAGLMHGSWDSNHFRSAAAGLLHFSPESATLIRRGLTPQVTVDGSR
jgi:hypothetical protein